MTQQDINRAQEYLMRGRGIKQELAELRQRKDKKYAELIKASAGRYGERVQCSHGNTEEQKRIEYSELIQSIKGLETKLDGVLSDTLNTISLIDNSRLRRFLCAYYIDCMTLEETAELLELSPRHIHRVHKKAVIAFAEAIKKSED